MLELAILGDPTVGKSSLIDRFCNDKFSLTYTPTTRMSYTCKTISLSGKKLKLKIWDTAGQANHDSYFNTFCNERTGFVLMYSTQDPDSLQNLKLWIENLTKNFNRKIKAVVVGNKVSGEDSKISSTDLEQFVLEYNLRHFEVNIQDDFEIHMPFLELAAIMVEDDSDFGDSSVERPGTLMLSKERFDEQIQYNYYEKRPFDEVVLEYKQELLDLSTNYSEFKLFITNELNQMDRKTKEHLQQIEEQHHSLLGRINEMHIGTKDYDAKSIQHTELELDFYDNNAPQTTLHIGSQGAENEIYRLKQKIESFEKRLTEGLCYMENKLKLTCSTLTKQLKHSSMAEIGSEENELVRKRSQARTTTHASQFRRSICYGHGMTKERTENNEEPGTFTEAVDNHSLTPLQTSPLIGRMNSFQAGLEKAAEGEFTPRKRVNSLDTLDLSSEGFPHVQEREHHSAELFEENYGDQEQKSEPEIHQEELEVENNCEYQYQDQDGGNYVEVKQEIVTIWNTLNQVINNTQDCFQELKSDIANTSMNREGFSHYGIAERSSLEHKGNELKIEVRKKSLSEDKDLQDIIVEVKDEVHNQIVNVQKELEEKVNYLRNNIVHQYSNFSEKMHLDQVEMKRYVDEKIDYTKLEIQGSLYPNQEEENVITSHLGLDHNEGQESQNEHPNHSISQVVEDLALLQKDKEEREKEVKIQRDLLESLKGKVSALEGSTIGNVWNTISLVASRLEKIEQALKLKKV